MRRLALALALLVQTGAAAAATPQEAARAWRAAHEREILSGFMKLLALPNVATRLEDVDRNAEVLEAELARRGFSAQLLRAAPGSPASVFGSLPSPGATRTVLFYAHYDGQPVGQTGWVAPPFAPSIRTALPEARPVDIGPGPGPVDPDLRIYGRGSGDDKASVWSLLMALDALRAAGLKPSVNVKVLWEGEEEQGSAHFGQIVRANRALLAADALIMGDGPIHQSGRQIVAFGNRGIVGGVMTVYGPAQPLHDGHYGSFAPSPSVMIAHLIADIRNEDGAIRIPGFEDDVAPPRPEDLAAIAAMPAIEPELRRSLGLGRSIGPERIAAGYLRPTFNVRAIHVGDEGPNAANAIATDGSFSFDVRLVAGETPARVREKIEAWLAGRGWRVVHAAPDAAVRRETPRLIRIAWDAGEGEAAKTPLNLPAGRAVVASIGRTEGYAPIVEPTSGGSSGIAEAAAALGTPMIGVSVANYDDNQHARNENLRIGNLWDGIAVYAGLLGDLRW